MGLSTHPPHGSRRAAFPHRALASGMAVAGSRVQTRTLPVRVLTRRSVTTFPARCLACDRSLRTSLGQAPFLHPLRRRRPTLPCSRTSSVLRTCPTSHDRTSSATAPRLPDADLAGLLAHRSVMRPPRFRRVPFRREVAFDPGGASAPRMTAPHILPSTNVTASASATFGISWLNPTPRMIAVYASQCLSPDTTQHSLMGGPLHPYPCRTSTGWITPASPGRTTLRR